MHKSNGGYEFWDNEKERVLHLYLEEEKSCEEIGRIYNCYGSTIGSHLKRWGIEIRKRRANAQGWLADGLRRQYLMSQLLASAEEAAP